jgi:hypothetical protein
LEPVEQSVALLRKLAIIRVEVTKRLHWEYEEVSPYADADALPTVWQMARWHPERALSHLLAACFMTVVILALLGTAITYVADWIFHRELNLPTVAGIVAPLAPLLIPICWWNEMIVDIRGWATLGGDE